MKSLKKRVLSDEVEKQPLPVDSQTVPTQGAGDDYAVVFKHKDGRVKRVYCDLNQLLQKNEEDFYEQMCMSDECCSSGCNNESQNFCDCPSMYEDFEFSHVESHPTASPVTEDVRAAIERLKQCQIYYEGLNVTESILSDFAQSQQTGK